LQWNIDLSEPRDLLAGARRPVDLCLDAAVSPFDTADIYPLIGRDGDCAVIPLSLVQGPGAVGRNLTAGPIRVRRCVRGAQALPLLALKWLYGA